MKIQDIITESMREAEGEPEGVKHISKKLLQHIVQQVGTEGAHAIVKSLEWGNGAAKELLQLIVRDLKQDIAGMKEARQSLDENFELHHEPTASGGVEIHAYRDGKEMGWVRFSKLKTGQVKAAMVHVPERFRRQGVASAMYKYARHKLGLDIAPSDVQTDQGRAFWNKVHEDFNLEDRHPNDPPYGPETKPTMPKGTVRVDVSDVYDWYKLGTHISDLKNADKSIFGKGPPSTIFSFGSEDEEHEYIKALEKLGLTTTDIDPVDPNQPKGMPRQKVDPTFNVGENFADGKNPQDKGDSQRHGIPKGATISQLEKASHAKGRKGQLARWQLNMRRGRAKS